MVIASLQYGITQERLYAYRVWLSTEYVDLCGYSLFYTLMCCYSS